MQTLPYSETNSGLLFFDVLFVFIGPPMASLTKPKLMGVAIRSTRKA